MLSTIQRGDDAAGAIFSACMQYRYVLWRRWREGNRGRPLFIMLNPSTADERRDDPTIRRCCGYAKRWDYDGLAVCNLYALRATDPRRLTKVTDSIGPDNDHVLSGWCHSAPLIVCAWGVRGEPYGARMVPQLLTWGGGKPLHALGQTRLGSPRHPLYLRGDLMPVVWINPDGSMQ